MKKVSSIVMPLLALLLLFGNSSCTRIDAGHAGIKVYLYGQDKGVQDIVEVTGFVWYNPLTTTIYEFPTYIQHKVWTSDMSEDSPRNEEFTVTTKDGLSVSFDVGLDYAVIPEQVPTIFRKYRKTLPEITNEFLRTMVRTAYNKVASSYKTENLVSSRAEYESKVRNEITSKMKTAGFQVNQVAIVGKIRLPPAIQQAINDKIKASQDALKAEREKQKVEAEAAKDIAEARGHATADSIRAVGRANANRKVEQTLTPLLIQKMFIEKWDGKLPTYGTVPKIFKNIN